MNSSYRSVKPREWRDFVITMNDPNIRQDDEFVPAVIGLMLLLIPLSDATVTHFSDVPLWGKRTERTKPH